MTRQHIQQSELLLIHVIQIQKYLLKLRSAIVCNTEQMITELGKRVKKDDFNMCWLLLICLATKKLDSVEV